MIAANPELTLVAVYDDPVELDIRVSNGWFAGRTAVYLGVGKFNDLARHLAGFPSSVYDRRTAGWSTLHPSSGLGGAKLESLCVDNLEYAGVWIELNGVDADLVTPW